MIKILQLFALFFSNYVHVFNFIYKFPFFAKNVFFSILAVEGPLSLLSALECKILEINFYYRPNHDFFKRSKFWFPFYIFNTLYSKFIHIFFFTQKKNFCIFCIYIAYTLGESFKYFILNS